MAEKPMTKGAFDPRRMERAASSNVPESTDARIAAGAGRATGAVTASCAAAVDGGCDSDDAPCGTAARLICAGAAGAASPASGGLEATTAELDGGIDAGLGATFEGAAAAALGAVAPASAIAAGAFDGATLR
jgi:hypothetical protein